MDIHAQSAQDYQDYLNSQAARDAGITADSINALNAKNGITTNWVSAPPAPPVVDIAPATPAPPSMTINNQSPATTSSSGPSDNTNKSSSPTTATFKPTGNVPTDLAYLESIGADAFTVSQYVAQYGGMGNLDDNTPNATDKEKKAAKYLRDLGITKALNDVETGNDAYYEFDNPDTPNSKIKIPKSIYDKATPDQQFALLKKYGVIPNDAKIIKNNDGTWGYTLESQEKGNGIPDDLYQTYIINEDKYVAAGKPPPLHFDHNITGQVTITPYMDPSKAVTYALPENANLLFRNDKGMPVIDKLIDKKTGNIILQADSTGKFKDDDIRKAINNNSVSRKDAITMFGQDNVDRIMNPKPQNNAVTPEIYDQWASDLNYYQKDIYKKAGGGKAGFDAVQNAQAQALLVLSKFQTENGYDLKAAHEAGVTQITMMNAGFSAQQISDGLGMNGKNKLYKPSIAIGSASYSSDIGLVNPHTIQSILSERGMTKDQIQIKHWMENYGIELPDNLTGEQVVKLWQSIPGSDKLKIQEYNQTYKYGARPVNLGWWGLVPLLSTLVNFKQRTPFGNVIGIKDDVSNIVILAGGIYSVGKGTVKLLGTLNKDETGRTLGQIMNLRGTRVGSLLNNLASDESGGTIKNIYTPRTVQKQFELQLSDVQKAQIAKELGVNAKSIRMGPVGFMIDDPDYLAEWKAVLGRTGGGKSYVYYIPKSTIVNEVSFTSGPEPLKGGYVPNWGSRNNVITKTSTLTPVWTSKVAPTQTSIAQQFETRSGSTPILNELNKIGIVYLGNQPYKVVNNQMTAITSDEVIQIVKYQLPNLVLPPKTSIAEELKHELVEWQQIETQLKQKTKLAPQIQPKTIQITGIQVATDEKSKTSIKPLIKSETANKIALQKSLQIKTATKTQLQNSQQQKNKEMQKLETMPAFYTQPMVKTATKTTIKTSVKEKETGNEQNTGIMKGLAKPTTPPKDFKPTTEDYKNATSFKAGFGWWFRFPNGIWKFERKLPAGVQQVAPGKGSGHRSVQTVEGTPIITSKRLGAVNVFINRPSHQPGKAGAITYKPTHVGRPGLSIKREGHIIHIKDMGLARRMPKGRISRKQ